MSKIPQIALSTALLIAVNPQLTQAGVTQTVEDALNFYHYGNNGAVKLDLNYRWENVNEDNKLDTVTGLPLAKQPNTVNANTARLRAGLLSPVLYGLQGYAEFEGNWAMQPDF